jgi:hypothetical protein
MPPLIVFSNAIYKTRPIPCKRHKFQDHEFACHGLDESQDKLTDGDGNEMSRSGTSNFSFHNANGGKVQQTADPFLNKHQNDLLPYIKQNNQERELGKSTWVNSEVLHTVCFLFKKEFILQNVGNVLISCKPVTFSGGSLLQASNLNFISRRKKFYVLFKIFVFVFLITAVSVGRNSRCPAPFPLPTTPLFLIICLSYLGHEK